MIKFNEKVDKIILEMLNQNIDVTLTVTGNSMLPLWRHKRDEVLLAKCDKSALKKGDIPFYRRSNGQYVIHRIVKVNKYSYNLCGDAQTDIEYNLPKENIIAVVKGFTRKRKVYSCQNLLFRIYSAVWMPLRPIRSFILTCYVAASGSKFRSQQQKNKQSSKFRGS